jgi:hypothetical protein
MSKKILLNPETEKKICEMSEYCTQKEIAIKYGHSQSFINSILKRNNIVIGRRNRLNECKLNINESFFEEIDNTTKAYWLGYLAADGNISKNLRKCTLVSKDKEIIDKFKKDTLSEHKISTIIIKDKRTNHTSTGYTIQITNRFFVEKLLKYGITPQKSEIFNVPNIDESLYPYFFAGLFDGDGSVGTRKNNTPRISLISTKEVLMFLQNYLINKLLISSTKLQNVTKNKKNVWKLFLYKDAFLFLNWIYSDKNFNYLSRKYGKYISHIR